MRTVWLAVLVALLGGCETLPEETRSPTRASLPQAIPALHGSYHIVQRGETLWRIAHSYGLEPAALAAANRLPNTSRVAVGQRLFIPLPTESGRFLWPVRGTLRSSSGTHGIDIAGAPGSLVRAAKRGRVAVATHRLAGWGKTVIIDHLDGYMTIYSGLEQILVEPGVTLRQGVPVGSLGSRALHFEIRLGETPKNALALLPRE